MSLEIVVIFRESGRKPFLASRLSVSTNARSNDGPRRRHDSLEGPAAPPEGSHSAAEPQPGILWCDSSLSGSGPDGLSGMCGTHSVPVLVVT